ncbi:adenylate kinase (plasmid) [Agrobacterium tumefaciens]|jgi:adenylate kinase|uniref:adenylate kinase n=1 Tax=Agrobacterium tumefaciens TaxID=358 RepID=UPI001571966C|nr:adenylate kinase [Agrobacterium tumefaciens]NSZ76961.1 adenylate kinase [Agrobacterium tumefaciens]NSZ87443.1 adenylate kinase [Agrobacterium tumefaciens]WCA72663.1 adenylate kinase [Agrobacterium tumefaciens]
MHIVMLGPPGAGKGTQSSRLALAFRIPHLSTGDILRAAIRDATPLGLQAKAAVDSGALVDDATITGCVKERLAKPDVQGGFILDGFPRTIEQALTLDVILKEAGVKVDIAFELVVDIEHLRQRIAKRATDAAAAKQEIRSDDNENALRKRVEAYLAHGAPLSEFYRSQAKLVEIDGLTDVETVTSKLTLAIESVFSGRLPSA